MRYEYPKSAATVKLARVKRPQIVKEYHIEIDGKVLLLRRTFRGKLLSAARRFLKTFPIALIGVVVLFAIEWIGRGSDESHLVFYVASALGISGVLGGAFALTRFLRDDLWALDLGERVLAFETSMPWGQARSAHIGLGDVKTFRLEHVGRRATLKVLVEDHEEVLAVGRAAHVNQLCDEVRAFLKRHRSSLTIERGM